MAVGPHGINLLARDASFEIFGQVGILYLMFLASVEIDMFNLKLNARKGLVFGLLTFAIPMAAGIVGSVLAFGVGWLSAALIASVYASHTLISYPIINRFRLQNLKSVVIAVSATIIAVLRARGACRGGRDKDRGQFPLDRHCQALWCLWCCMRVGRIRFSVAHAVVFP